ncbi:MAG: hypothetical protein HY931_00460 [Candidatus Falkowbacteria bacterium]|nr:MAG: hypothetical protein HY931_00460 [Candidatus Falkowbacteria bacterium]
MRSKRTKQSIWFLVAFGLILLSLIALSSCEQEAEIPAPAEKVKIFVNSSSSADGLKSASTTDKTTEVAVGDTIWFSRDIPALMWAITESGLPANGSWKIEAVKTDIIILFNESSGYNPIGRYTTYFGDQIAHKFPEIGLYRVSFGQLSDANSQSEDFVFFIRIGGNPGKVGDGADNDYIFRMESKTVTDTSTKELRNLIYVYFKFSEGINMKPEQAYCRLTDFRKNGTEISRMIHLRKWQFSRDYYYLVIPPDNESMRRYRAIFMVSETQGFDGYADRNNYRSSWWTNYGIEFAAQ